VKNIDDLKLIFSEPETHFVIGSGPAGVSCAMALIKRGLKVLMIDVGQDISPKTKALVEKLRQLSPEKWEREDIDSLRPPTNMSRPGVIQKLCFGSKHIFGSQYGGYKMISKSFAGDYSFAVGGLSTVWGAAMLPILDSEIDNWPIKYTDLEPYYQQVLHYVPLTSRSDALTGFFPNFDSATHNNLLSPQGEFLASRFNQYKDKLLETGLTGGAARLAVRTNTVTTDGCQNCGMCFYGCVYDSIYCSTQTLNMMLDSPNFQYISNYLVESFEEIDTSLVSLKIRNIHTDSLLNINCTALYIACGTLPTAKLVLESTKSYDKIIPILDNQMSLFPFFLFKSLKRTNFSPKFTLAQNFFELSNPRLTKRLVHFQTYPYSEIITKVLSRIIPSFILNAPFFSRHFLERIMIVQMFLHSDDSQGATLVLSKDSHGRSTLIVNGSTSAGVLKKVSAIITSIFKKAPLMGGFVFPRFSKSGLPGGSYHIGGTFPMSSSPGHLQTNKDGLLYGYKQVRIVDASVFPSLPASSITFTIMANAYRIGSISTASTEKV
jgi:choline dehydrogenase-like flavoprotein